jgi:DNA-binding HxlR family transcriptional regulator
MADSKDSNQDRLKYCPQPTLNRVTTMNIFDTNCEAHQILEHIANKWTILIVFALSQGTKRYNELKQQIKVFHRQSICPSNNRPIFKY